MMKTQINRAGFFSSFFFVLVLCAVGPDAAGQTRQSKAGSYYRGTYPNLFVELLSRKESEVKVKLDLAFTQIFFGDDKLQRIYYPVGEDMAYVLDVNNNDVRTEGMSYGMMICVQLDKKNEFDRIWKWAVTHMQFQSGAHRGYFAWHCTKDGKVLDSTAASDGEEWFVMSLFFASARWGDGEGIFNYHAEANKILWTMLNKESEPGHDGVTNMFNKKEHLVAFVPNDRASDFSDPSYQLPHFYELWARWADADNQFWCDAAAASRIHLRKSADPSTGLSPDYSNFDGTPVRSRPGGHVDFRFDAWRVAMNVATDFVWFVKDQWAVTEANRLLDFFWSEGIDTYGNQYSLKGKKLGDDHSTGLVAMNAVAALAATNSHRTDFVRALWNADIPHGHYRYYDGMLYMLGMLQVSGNFKIYDPTGKPVDACQY